ncbi:hypothetical protein NP233_g2695 [Leucocoprinus birnbaumii]|uniref:Uncharacterized protein n=1 Tax=Leucocoprinus birnbaumii TaxID=56174 RepID=A0AAD5YYV5_9AGAR|nr:hypothetical protein NP233_g2695 [Leucocoprinus birnbaumii]
MDDESSDILGQQTKPVLRGSKNASSFGASLAAKLVFGFVVLSVLYVVVMRIWFRILVWKERSYKLATRRRHGIPDNDHRPFNVAYAAVLRARQQEKDVAQKANATQPAFSGDRRNAQSEQSVRQRFGLQARNGDSPRALSYSSRFPGAFLTEGTPVRTHVDSATPPPVVVGGGRYPSQSRRYESGPPSYLNGTRRASKRSHELESGYGGQKRGFVEDSLDEQDLAKRTKHDDWSVGDEVDDPVWQDQVPPQRGAKRYLFEEEENEEDLIERQPRDKRQRKVSLDKGIQADRDDLDMDIDEDEDEIDDLPYIQRGKKRDRAEAGSTFGGDDEDSGIELDSPDSKPKRHTRKRRTFSKRKSDIPIRGQKRDRDIEDEEIDLESDDENSYVLRKKRGKRPTLRDDNSSEHSTSRSQTSSGSRNRAIGEEWTSNGIHWKVGPNGQRLRQALVKRSTQKFSMPEDSQHPDRSVDFEVYVETWLTEEEYRDAKQRHALAGQDTPQRSDNKPTLDVQTQSSGKNLLWSATSTPLDSPVSRSPVSERALGVNQRITRTSLTSSSVSRINPFDQPAHTMRRISSISRAPSAGAILPSGLTDATNSSPHTRYKTYSKLEKQELEAQALMKLRELKNKREAGSTQAKDEQADKAAPSFAIPTITVTTPSDSSKASTQPPPLNLSKPAENGSKPAEAPKPASPVPFPSSADGTKPAEAAKPSLFPATTAFPSIPTPTNPKTSEKPAAPPSFFSSTAPSAPASTPIGGTASVATDAVAKPEKPVNAPISFGFPGSAPQSNPSASFFAPAATGQTAVPVTAGSIQQPPAPQSSIGGPSLLSRLGLSTNSNPIPATATSNPPRATSFFNLTKPNTVTTPTPTASATTPNLFGANTSQPTTQPTPSANNNQPSFKFNFAAPASSSATTNADAAPPAPSSNLFGPKAPARPSMVTFTPLTPGGGSKDDKIATDASKSTPNPSLFGFKAPAAGVNNDVSKPPTSVFGGAGGSSPFGTAGPSNAGSVFGTTAFGAKPAETKPAESSTSTQSTKPLFNFGMTGGQTSSSSKDTSTSQPPTSVFSVGAGPSSAAAAKPAPASSSLFGALGPQTTTAFGTTSLPGTTGATGSTNIFGAVNNGSSNTSSAPVNLFGASNAGGTSGSTSSNIFGTKASTSSSSQPSNVFGNTGGGNLFGANAAKPTEAPKSVFGMTSAPAAGGAPAIAPSTEQDKPTFKFQMPPSNSGTTSTPGTSGATAASSSGGPQFTFNFGMKSTPNPTFGATSGGQSGFSAKPTPFNVGSTFGSTGGSPAFNPLGAASQNTASEQK